MLNSNHIGVFAKQSKIVAWKSFLKAIVYVISKGFGRAVSADRTCSKNVALKMLVKHPRKQHIF